jgi:folylpolyglutamate synthase/dihydropteroate synthase
VIAVLAILADKDATATVEALAPTLTRAVCTELPHQRRFEAAELARACEAAGLAAEAEADFAAAVERGRELALAEGGVLLVAGSHYALTPARAALALCED